MASGKLLMRSSNGYPSEYPCTVMISRHLKPEEKQSDYFKRQTSSVDRDINWLVMSPEMQSKGT